MLIGAALNGTDGELPVDLSITIVFLNSMIETFTFHIVRPSYCRVSVYWHVERAIHTPVSRSIRHCGASLWVPCVTFDANLMVMVSPEVWKFINDQLFFVFTARLFRFRWSRCFLDLPSLSPAPQLAFFRHHTPSFPFSFSITMLSLSSHSLKKLSSFVTSVMFTSARLQADTIAALISPGRGLSSSPFHIQSI